MLSHHVDTTDDSVTSLAHSLSHLRNAVPAWLPLQTFIRLSERNPLDQIPSDLNDTVSRLVQLFDDWKLTRDTPRFQPAFETFLWDLSRQSPSLIEITIPDVDRLRATICLDIMAKELRFNICKSPSSFLRSKDVPKIEALKAANISSHLRYACHQWTTHVCQMETLDVDLLEMLSDFFQTRFLYWLEVMGLLGLSPFEALKNLDPAPVRDSTILATLIRILIYPC